MKRPARTKRHQARREVALTNLEKRLADSYLDSARREMAEREAAVLRQRLGKVM